VPRDVFAPEFSKRGVWSKISLGKARTIDKGKFSSHSVVIIFGLVFQRLVLSGYLPDISSSLFKPSMMALNRNDQQSL
jgi:hypothetical protein